MISDVQREVALANRILWASGLSSGITAALGHASMRVPDQPDRFVVKGRGYKMDALSAMRATDMVTCDLDGNYIDGPPGSTQCFEVKMHSWLYKLYPAVQSVVHVHPRFTVLLSTLGRVIKPLCQEGVALVARPLPVYPHTKVVVSRRGRRSRTPDGRLEGDPAAGSRGDHDRREPGRIGDEHAAPGRAGAHELLRTQRARS